MPDKLPPDDLRSVWQSQTEEDMGLSLDEIRRKAEGFQRRISRRNLREAAAAIFVVAVFGYYFWHFHAIYMRLASALTIAGTFYAMYHMFKKGSAQTVRADLAATACLAFHRGELVRQRDLLRNIWRWYLGPFIPGQIVFILGGLLQADRLRWGMAFYPVFAALVFWWVGRLNARGARKLQKEIDWLDAMEELL